MAQHWFNKQVISPRPLVLSSILILGTAALGLLIRFAPLDLPLVLVKYGGSMLWALMIYWMVSTLCCLLSVAAAGMAAAFVATSVECLKLYHSPGLDAFRLTLPGVLLLGRVFSLWDVVAYWLAILFGTLIDKGIRSSQRHPKFMRTYVPSRSRVVAAAVAAFISIAICVAQHHVHVVLLEPYTYGSPFRHKCGLLVIGSTIWAMLESTRYVARRRSQTRGHDEA
ncbi:ribosomal maturation YjgA family protein [Granulicella arctica]|uniref:ribosomal maturation YjgA family protein n=1 Tax=Granulicella arctica TaxID=940613 RepID=UPI0021DFABC5|nr:DUF2809 domain-containing protein [Granulicella arctica]